MIVTDLKQLNVPTEKVTSVDEGKMIATTLFQLLPKTGGIGLAANQVGIPKQVAVINVKEPIFLINPKIVETGNEINFKEGCLSIKKKKQTHTKRYDRVVIESENYEGKQVFEANGDDDFDGLLECICVQHEIDHLQGKTILDRKYTPEILKSDKIGRNQKVTISNGSETKTVKYKKAESLMEAGWKLEEILS